ncbi:MAG: glycosyltransferase family 2 protein [bacterium]
MDLSIIILNYKAKGLVKQCLKGIKLLNLGLKYEVIVVDNHSGDSSVTMIKEQFPWVKLVEAERNCGFAAGNNLGIKEAVGKYVMILNPDITVLEGAIETMYEYMEKNPLVGISGPKLINPDGTVQYSCYHFPGFMVPIYRRTFLGNLPWAKKTLRHYLMKDWAHDADREVDWLLGACLFVRKSALDKVGLLDERFFLYFEDVDWCRRFWQAGFKVSYLAEAEMVHYHQRLSAENPGWRGLFSNMTRIHIASWIKYFAKYLGVNKNKK